MRLIYTQNLVVHHIVNLLVFKKLDFKKILTDMKLETDYVHMNRFDSFDDRNYT